MTARASHMNSIPVLERPLTLHSLHAIKTYQRTFRALETNLYLSAVLVRLHGERTRRYAAQIRQVEEVIGEFLQEAQDGLSEREQALGAQLHAAQQRPEELGITYRNPLHGRVAMRTPQAVQLLAVFQSLDRLCQALDTAWFSALLTTEAYLEQCSHAARQITTLAGRISLLARGVARCVLGEGEAGGAYTAFLQKRLGGGGAESASEEALEERDTAETLALVERVEALVQDGAPVTQPAAGAGQEVQEVQDNAPVPQLAEGAGEAVQDSVLPFQRVESAGAAAPDHAPVTQPVEEAGGAVQNETSPFQLEESAGGAKPGLLRAMFGQGGRAG